MEKLNLLFNLLEHHKVFISPRLTPRKLAILMKTDLREIEKLAIDNTGLAIRDIILLYRKQYIESLMAQGIDFRPISGFSGLRSIRD